MKSKGILIIVGALAVVCLGAIAAALVLLFQVQALPLPFLRGQSLQSEALAAACAAPAHTVPGTYQADPLQTVGDWTVIIFTAECDAPGQPRQAVGGLVANNGRGVSCSTSASLPALAPAASGPVTIAVESVNQCGQSGPAGLSVVHGIVIGPGPVSAQALSPGGVAASAPIRAGRFVLLAPGDASLCTVRALDASGAVLAESTVGGVGAGHCP